MEHLFPIVRHPEPGTGSPVLVSVPHYGTEPLPRLAPQPEPGTGSPALVSVPHYGPEPLPHITQADYGEPWFETFAYGFADTFASDLYGGPPQHRATVLGTPLSRTVVG